MEEQQKEEKEKRAISDVITPLKLTRETKEFFENNKWVSKSNFMREAVDKKIKEIREGTFRNNETEETKDNDLKTGVKLFKDQEEFFNEYKIFTKSRFIRTATSNLVKEFVNKKNNFQKSSEV